MSSTTFLLRNVSDAWNSLARGQTHFEEEWDRFKTRGAADLQGCWAGTWRSNDLRKQGPLKCVLTRIAPATYVASFCVRCFGRFPVSYDVQFRVLERENRFDIEGAADLGLLAGGVHHFDGRASLHDLWCNYSARRETGKLELKRML